MRLSIYLLRESVKDFDEVLQPKYLDGDAAFEELAATRSLPYKCKAYVQVNKSKAPSWQGFLSSAFDVASRKLLNQSSSFVLLVKNGGRFFAITFGHGFQAIDPAKIEPRFGLMVAANCLTELNSLETNLIDRLTSNKKVHVGKGSKIHEFGLNPQIDWIRRMSGALGAGAIAKSISGSDSCSISVDCVLANVGDKCKKLLKLFKSDAYKTEFDFLDQLQPISRHDPRVTTLEAELVKRLEDRSYDRVSVAFPEMPNEQLLEHYKISSGGSMILQELSLEGIYAFLDEKHVPADPNNIYVIGIGENDSAVTQRRRLRDYLACELQQDGETFIFCSGEWFQAETDYVKKIRKAVANLPDVSAELELPPVKNAEWEGDYNKRAASLNGLLLMDKANFRMGGSYDKSEVCDLLTDNAMMLCVKKMENSSSMSHLFSQGSVSATLLRSEEKYRKNLNKSAKAKWHGFTEIDESNIGKVTVVFAIACRKHEPLSEGLFFFSLVNLLNQERTIRMTGCRIALCKIDYESAPTPPMAAKRRKKMKAANVKKAKKAKG